MSCWASVLATTNSTPCRLAAIMLSTALVPPPPTPMTVMRGVKSVWLICGIVRFRVILLSPPGYGTAFRFLLRLRTRFAGKSDTFFQKIDQTAKETDRQLTFELHVMKRSSVAGCPGKQTGSGCERWPGGKLRQAAQRCRTTKTHLTAKHAGCHFTHTRKLA